MSYDHKAVQREVVIERRRLRKRANYLVRKAIKQGKLVRGTHCEDCGKLCKTQAHHRDYRKPLEVVWLCINCHSKRPKVTRNSIQPSTRLLKPREVADRCGVKPRTVAKWLRDRELVGVKMSSNSWRVEEAELERFIASRRVSPD